MLTLNADKSLKALQFSAFLIDKFVFSRQNTKVEYCKFQRTLTGQCVYRDLLAGKCGSYLAIFWQQRMPGENGLVHRVRERISTNPGFKRHEGTSTDITPGIMALQRHIPHLPFPHHLLLQAIHRR